MTYKFRGLKWAPVEISNIERNPKECRLILQGRGLDILINGHLPVEMRDQQLPARDLNGRWQSRPHKMLQRRDSSRSVDDITALCSFELLRLGRAQGRQKRGPEIRHCVDDGRTLESGDQRVFVIGICFDDFDALLLQLLRPGGVGVTRDSANLPAGFVKEGVDY